MALIVGPQIPIEQAIVVDDDPVIRGILRSTLAGIGLGVHLAADGAAAIAIAKRKHVGLFLLDLQMPGTNGLQTCRQLRLLPGYAQTPIVVLTGLGTPRTHAAAIEVGATMFLTKPFKPANLLKAITPFLTGQPATAAPPAEPSDVWAAADPEYRKQLWGRQDAQRASNTIARGESGLGID